MVLRPDDNSPVNFARARGNAASSSFPPFAVAAVVVLLGFALVPAPVSPSFPAARLLQRRTESPLCSNEFIALSN